MSKPTLPKPRIRELAGFLVALAEAKRQAPEHDPEVWRRVAEVEVGRAAARTLRVSPTMLLLHAEFHALCLALEQERRTP